MSNKDINNQDVPKKISESELSMKDNMHLFSLSLLKSDKKITLSNLINSFNYEFSKDNNEPKKRKKIDSSINNRIISLIDGDKNSSLKTLNIEVPSSEKLSDETFKNDFLNNYENSFAQYCGISKKQYKDIYINNRYIPILNEFGDINIPIKNIVDLIKTYSINLKVGRKMAKRNRFKRIFKTQRKKTNLEKKGKNIFLFEVKKNNEIKNKNTNGYINNINDIKKDQIINLKEIDNNKNKIDDTKKENYNNNIHHSGINNIKNRIIHEKGNILIPKNENPKGQLNNASMCHINTSSLGLGNLIQNSNFLYNYNTFTNDGNKRQINNINNNNNPTSFNIGNSAIQPNPENKQNISPSNYNFFNFSNKNIQNYSTNVLTNNINNNVISNNIGNTSNNINNISQMNNPLISPFNNTLLSPRFFCDILTPYNSLNPKSNISTPRMNSPIFNNYIIQDRFTYNNINTNSFLFGNNSLLSLNNNNVNNNILESNIINNKKNNNNNNNVIFNEIDKNVNNNENYNKEIIDSTNNITNNITNNNQNNNNANNLLRKNMSLNLKINLNNK